MSSFTSANDIRIDVNGSSGTYSGSRSSCSGGRSNMEREMHHQHLQQQQQHLTGNNTTLLKIGEATALPVMLCGLLQKELLIQQRQQMQQIQLQLQQQQQLNEINKYSTESSTSSGFFSNRRTSSAYSNEF